MDSDFAVALSAVGQSARSITNPGHASSLRLGAHGDRVAELQGQLASLHILDQDGRLLSRDGHFGPATKSAVERFQAENGLVADGVVGPRTRQLLEKEVELSRQANATGLNEERHPGASMYTHALDGVRTIDRQLGRTTDEASHRLAGALAVGAYVAGFDRVDHVMISGDGSRAYAIQGQLDSPLKRYMEVDVARSLATPLEQSSAEFLRVAQQREQQGRPEPMSRAQEQTQVQQAAPRYPAATR